MRAGLYSPPATWARGEDVADEAVSSPTVASTANVAGRNEWSALEMLDLTAGDTRVFLFHSPGAAADPGAAMDKVNSWLGKDRSDTAYSNLKVRKISVTSDGQGGVFTTVVCSLGRMATPLESDEAI